MSTERTDQYPEVSGEDAGIVPPQGSSKQEWPKKIRTLTANELDRLTIDGLGRFYWDGRLVNYEPPVPRVETPADLDQHAMDLLDQAARDLDPNAQATAADVMTAEVVTEQPVEQSHEQTLEQPGSSEAPHLAATAADQLAPLTADSPVVATAAAPVIEVRRHEYIAPMAHPQTTRIVLTGWQSIALALVIASFLVTAIGMAASGFVAVHDWGCKSGTFTRGCALPPAPPKPPARPEIPA